MGMALDIGAAVGDVVGKMSAPLVSDSMDRSTKVTVDAMESSNNFAEKVSDQRAASREHGLTTVMGERKPENFTALEAPKGSNLSDRMLFDHFNRKQISDSKEIDNRRDVNPSAASGKASN